MGDDDRRSKSDTLQDHDGRPERVTESPSIALRIGGRNLVVIPIRVRWVVVFIAFISGVSGTSLYKSYQVEDQVETVEGVTAAVQGKAAKVEEVREQVEQKAEKVEAKAEKTEDVAAGSLAVYQQREAARDKEVKDLINEIKVLRAALANVLPREEARAIRRRKQVKAQPKPPVPASTEAAAAVVSQTPVQPKEPGL